MRRKPIALVLALVTTMTLGACSGSVQNEPTENKPETTTESSPQSETDLPADSILTFDGNEGSAKLVADMESGNYPTECMALYDQMGALPPVTLTDEESICKVYELLADVTVVDESEYSITDNYHAVSFLLQDGTRVGFNFEGEELLSRGTTNYSIKGSGPLWAYVRTLQAAITGGKNVYVINVEADDGIIVECPQTAEERTSVRVVCENTTGKAYQVYVNDEELLTGSDIYISVGGSEEKTPTQKKKYEFIMPSSDVALRVTVEQ